MTKGGARARSGPAPDPDSLTQVDGEWTILPAAGREGPAPSWPLPSPSERELLLWSQVWESPQAVMWERFGQVLEVALFVRTFGRAEERDATAALVTLVRQGQEALGLSMPGMLRNRWRIEDVDAPSDEVVDDEDDPRNRLTVVSSGVA